jgi:hypothetical protein
MWTRRKKQNLFHLLLGILVGVAASCVVVSFQVIKRFTRENIAKLQELGRRDTVQVIAYRTLPAARAEVASEAVAVDSLVVPDSLAEAVEEVILSDVRIASAQLSVPVVGADSSRTEQRTLTVEQWENPMHFQGYRWDGRQLMIYGMDLEELDFLYREGHLFLRFGGQEVGLRETASFERFPVTFLHSLRAED